MRLPQELESPRVELLLLLLLQKVEMGFLVAEVLEIVRQLEL